MRNHHRNDRAKPDGNNTHDGLRIRRDRRLLRSLSSLVVAGGLVALTAVGAGATRPEVPFAARAHSTTVKPDLSYYRNKTIDFYDIDSIGGAYDVAALILCPYIGAYLHAKCNVIPVPGGGTITGQNVAEGQPPNGLTIGEVNVTGDVSDFVQHIAGLNFSLRSLPLLASLPPGEWVLVATPQSGFTSFKDVIGSKTPVTVFAEEGSAITIQEQLLIGAYNPPNKFIYGYASGSAIIQGFARGDAELSGNAFSQYESLILPGKAIPLITTPAPRKGQIGYAIMRKVPTVAAFAKSDPPKTKSRTAELQEFLTLLNNAGTAFFAPLGTPAKYQAALNAAIEWATTRKGAIAQLETAGLGSGGYIVASTTKRAIQADLKLQPQLAQWLQETGAPPAA